MLIGTKQIFRPSFNESRSMFLVLDQYNKNNVEKQASSKFLILISLLVIVPCFRTSRVQMIAATKTAPNTLSSTELFVFLANLPGFVLEDISAVYQFKKAKPFAPFIEKLVKMRQDADKDPKLAPLGNAAKLVANSS